LNYLSVSVFIRAELVKWEKVIKESKIKRE